MKIRFASDNDSAALLKIYAQYINTPITFEYELPDETEFAERIRTISREYPYLVCEDAGQTVGYAYAHRQKERAAYQWNAELSVYLDQKFTGKGLGSRLYQVLIGLLKLQGIRNVYGVVTLPNEKSERMHLSMGFNRLGIFQNTGYKCGEWQDVAWFEKTICPCERDPAPFRPVHAIPPRDLEEALLIHQK